MIYLDARKECNKKDTPFAALGALVVAFSRVRPHVNLQVTGSGVPFVTKRARERFFPRVRSQVDAEVTRPGKSLTTYLRKFSFFYIQQLIFIASRFVFALHYFINRLKKKNV